MENDQQLSSPESCSDDLERQPGPTLLDRIRKERGWRMVFTFCIPYVLGALVLLSLTLSAVNPHVWGEVICSSAEGITVSYTVKKSHYSARLANPHRNGAIPGVGANVELVYSILSPDKPVLVSGGHCTLTPLGVAVLISFVFLTSWGFALAVWCLKLDEASPFEGFFPPGESGLSEKPR